MENNIFEVSDIESFEKKLSQVREAQKKFAEYSQEQVDKIFKAAAIAATLRNRLIKFLRRLQ